MRQRLYLPMLIVAWLICSLPGTALAQFGGLMGGMPGGKSVGSTGTITVRRQPNQLRMFIELKGKGDSIETALAKLKERRDAAIAQLESLGADKGSIKPSDPSLSTAAQNNQQAQLQQMIRMQMQMGGRRRSTPKGLKAPRSVEVSATLTAEWPLEAKSAEDLLVITETLKEKVKAAKLSGTDEPEELSAEEQELAEEMTGMMMNSGSEQVDTGAPQFFYVAEISDEDRDKALAEAFVKAKVQAARLARAADVTLGPLVGLSGQDGGTNAYGSNPYADYMSAFSGDYEQQQYLQQLLAKNFSDDHAAAKENTTVASEPGALKFTFSVYAVFSVQE